MTATETADTDVLVVTPMPGRRRLPLSVALGLAIGGLLVVAVGAVLAVSLWGAGANTSALLSDKANLILQTATGQIRALLDPAADTADFLARRLEDGTIAVDDPNAIVDALRNGHAGLDQATGVIFIRPDNSAIGVRKQPDGGLGVGSFEVETPDFSSALERITAQPDQPMWGRPTWSAELETSVLNVVRGVTIDGELVGVIGVAVSIQKFSQFLDTLGGSLGQNGFALYGRDAVLAHPLLAYPHDGLSEAKPLPALLGFADPVLSQIWQTDESEPLEMVEFRPGASGHVLAAFGQAYIFVYESLAGYTDRPITIGTYFHSEDVSEELTRLLVVALIGGAIILVAVVAAIYTARRLARPFTRVASAAAQVGAMALDRIEDLPASRIREIDDQARAFNGMVRALRWLEIYVPRRLARRLLAATGGTVTSHVTDVTVMFTDIAGFTSWSEGRKASEVADFLNLHFALVGRAIEATGGTLDKFIGDAAMAFWGAPELQPDHAARACRAARMIAAAIDAENAEFAARGEPGLRMRIGIHSGPVIVGNIGAPERMNYTIVGDTVNVCQRLEQTGKTIDAPPGGALPAVVIIVSDATARMIADSDQTNLRAVGPIILRGRAEPIEAFQLGVTAPMPEATGPSDRV